MSQPNKERKSVNERLEDIETLLETHLAGKQKNQPPLAKLCKFLKSIYGQIGTILTIVGVITFFPRISVSPAQPLDLKNPFNNPFIIKNDGYLPLQNIIYSIELVSIKTRNNQNFHHVKLVAQHTVFQLGGNDQYTLFIDDMKDYWERQGGVETAKIVINLKYETFFFPLKLQKNLPFEIKKTPSEEFYWYPTQ